MRKLVYTVITALILFLSVSAQTDRLQISSLSATVVGQGVTLHIDGSYPHPSWGCRLGDISTSQKMSGNHIKLIMWQTPSRITAPCSTTTIFPLFSEDMTFTLDPGQYVIKVNNKLIHVTVQ